jgi:predicted DNA-binding protein (MmcQ/YjbR family)
VFKNGGKMSVCSGLESSSRYFFRAGDGFLELSDFPGIRPAPYLARAKWVQIDPASCQLGDAELICLIKDSYRQVLQKLPKKVAPATGRLMLAKMPSPSFFQIHFFGGS